MKIKYYGSSASEAWPALFCSCSACNAAAELGGKNIRTRHQVQIDDSLLIDFPPDTNYHIRQYGLDLRKIKNLLITHSHPDHFYPYDLANRVSQYTDGITISEMLHIYGNSTVKKIFSSVMKDYQNVEAVMKFHELKPSDNFVTEDHYYVEAFLADHKYDEQSLIYSIAKEKKKILFAHDTGIFPDETWEKLENQYFHCVSLDCTGVTKGWINGHMGFEAVKYTCKRMRRMRCIDDGTVIILSHFAHCTDMTHEKIEKIANENGCLAAYDGFECIF